MKHNLIINAVVLASCIYAGSASAQETTLAQDQNPRYKESERKYAQVADSLTSQQGTTIQNTYKAYDWYQARQERRQQNRIWGHEERMNGSYYDYTPSLSLYGGFSYPFNSYRGYGYGNRRGGRGRFGIGFGW